jgi:hypothetical protein
MGQPFFCSGQYITSLASAGDFFAIILTIHVGKWRNSIQQCTTTLSAGKIVNLDGN